MERRRLKGRKLPESGGDRARQNGADTACENAIEGGEDHKNGEEGGNKLMKKVGRWGGMGRCDPSLKEFFW